MDLRQHNGDEGTLHAEQNLMAHTRRSCCGSDSRSRRLWLIGQAGFNDDTRRSVDNDEGGCTDGRSYNAPADCSSGYEAACHAASRDSAACNCDAYCRSCHGSSGAELSERLLPQLVWQHGL
jgi:hypothetical protein